MKFHLSQLVKQIHLEIQRLACRESGKIAKDEREPAALNKSQRPDLSGSGKAQTAVESGVSS